MKNIFIKSADLEKNVKTTYKIPDFLMMENAAVALEKEVLDFANTKNTRCFVFIVCGSGNNGADGLAVARRVHSKIPVNVLLTKEPKTQESVIQKQMAEAALQFGSGLVSLIKVENSNLEQFKISPELMISDSIPQIKIILTPHLKELESLLTKTNVAKESGFEKITIADLQNAENKIKIGKAFTKK